MLANDWLEKGPLMMTCHVMSVVTKAIVDPWLSLRLYRNGFICDHEGENIIYPQSGRQPFVAKYD